MKKTAHTDLSRRKFVASVGAFSAVAVLPFRTQGADQNPASEEKPILKAGPYLQAPTPTGMTVRWLTHSPCLSWVEYGEMENQLNQKQETENFGLVQANNTINAITIANLAAGRTYYYRICSKKILSFEPYKVTFGETYTSKVFRFNTINPNPGKVAFLVFNDIHDRPESFPLLMQYNAGKKNDFVFLNGDMFNSQEDEDQLVSHLLQPFGQMFSSTPFFFSRGNHETRGKFARQFTGYFNGSEPLFYFSFQYGAMYAIVLDSGEDKVDGHPEYFGLVDFDQYRLKQAAWLEKEIEKPAFKNAKYKIVFSHIPLYYSGEWHGSVHCRQTWGPLLNRAKINLLISGHTHTYGIHPAVKGKHDYPIVIGGGPRDQTRTIIKVDFDSDSFNLTMLDDQGKKVGNVSL